MDLSKSQEGVLRPVLADKNMADSQEVIKDSKFSNNPNNLSFGTLCKENLKPEGSTLTVPNQSFHNISFEDSESDDTSFCLASRNLNITCLAEQLNNLYLETPRPPKKNPFAKDLSPTVSRSDGYNSLYTSVEIINESENELDLSQVVVNGKSSPANKSSHNASNSDENKTPRSKSVLNASIDSEGEGTPVVGRSPLNGNASESVPIIPEKEVDCEHKLELDNNPSNLAGEEQLESISSADSATENTAADESFRTASNPDLASIGNEESNSANNFYSAKSDTENHLDDTVVVENCTGEISECSENLEGSFCINKDLNLSNISQVANRSETQVTESEELFRKVQELAIQSEEERIQSEKLVSNFVEENSQLIQTVEPEQNILTEVQICSPKEQIILSEKQSTQLKDQIISSEEPIVKSVVHLPEKQINNSERQVIEPDEPIIRPEEQAVGGGKESSLLEEESVHVSEQKTKSEEPIVKSDVQNFLPEEQINDSGKQIIESEEPKIRSEESIQLEEQPVQVLEQKSKSEESVVKSDVQTFPPEEQFYNSEKQIIDPEEQLIKSKDQSPQSKKSPFKPEEKITEPEKQIPEQKEQTPQLREPLVKSKDQSPQSKKPPFKPEEKITEPEKQILEQKEQTPQSREQLVESKEQSPQSKKSPFKPEEKITEPEKQIPEQKEQTPQLREPLVKSKEQSPQSKEIPFKPEEKITELEKQILEQKEETPQSREPLVQSKEQSPQSKESPFKPEEKITELEKQILEQKEETPRSREPLVQSKEQSPQSKESPFKSEEKITEPEKQIPETNGQKEQTPQSKGHVIEPTQQPEKQVINSKKQSPEVKVKEGILEEFSESWNSEAGPVTAAEEIFEDPSAFDFLVQRGNNAVNSNLYKKSLFVKFDPLVDSFSPTQIEARITASQMADENSGDEKYEVQSKKSPSPITPLKNPALEAVGKLIEASPNVPGVNSKALEAELAKLQELLIQQEKEFKEKIQKMEKNEAKLKKEINEKAKNKDRLSTMLNEYEKTISQMVAQKEVWDSKLKAAESERDTTMQHLNNLEIAFNDVHQKYERSKVVIESLKQNEDILKGSVEEYDAAIKKQENKYEMLKQHAKSQLEKANQELDVRTKSQEAESAKLRALLKKAELKTSSLEQALEQKTKENQELMKICDELINKVGSS